MLQSEQFGVEIADAVRKVVGRTHIGEEAEPRNAHLFGKHGQSVHGKNVVHAQRSQEGALACHVRPRYNVVLVVLYVEVVAHSLFA